MRSRLLAGAAIGMIYLVSANAMAQTAPAEPVTPQDATAAPAATAPAVTPPAEAAPVAAAPAPASVPKGSPIIVEITDLVSTRTAHIDDTFNLKLAEPVMLNGVVVIPVGTQGKGVVIDAAKPGMGGKPGKLVLAARYLDFQGKQIPIRGLNMNMTATDGSGTAVVMSMAVGVFGLMVQGGQMEVTPGTRARAKLGADFVPDSTVAASQQDTPTDPSVPQTTPIDPTPAAAATANSSAPQTATADPTATTQNSQ